MSPSTDENQLAIMPREPHQKNRFTRWTALHLICIAAVAAIGFYAYFHVESPVKPLINAWLFAMLAAVVEFSPMTPRHKWWLFAMFVFASLLFLFSALHRLDAI